MMADRALAGLTAPEAGALGRMAPRLTPSLSSTPWGTWHLQAGDSEPHAGAAGAAGGGGKQGGSGSEGSDALCVNTSLDSDDTEPLSRVAGTSSSATEGLESWVPSGPAEQRCCCQGTQAAAMQEGGRR